LSNNGQKGFNRKKRLAKARPVRNQITIELNNSEEGKDQTAALSPIYR
jgi:hypothetical protein